MFVPVLFPTREVDIQNYYWYPKGFDTEELDRVDAGIVTLPSQTAGTGDENIQDLKIRSSIIKWIPNDESWRWLYDKMLALAIRANEESWNFNLYSALDSIQYTEYHADDNGHYDWHQDIGPGWMSKRKVSMTVQLSDPSEYEGGDLEYFKGGSIEFADKAPKGRGAVFVFPSFMMHRVSPVTKGVRRSFVLWVGGEPYR